MKLDHFFAFVLFMLSLLGTVYIIRDIVAAIRVLIG